MLPVLCVAALITFYVTEGSIQKLPVQRRTTLAPPVYSRPRLKPTRDHSKRRGNFQNIYKTQMRPVLKEIMNLANFLTKMVFHFLEK